MGIEFNLDRELAQLVRPIVGGNATRSQRAAYQHTLQERTSRMLPPKVRRRYRRGEYS